MSCIMGPGPGPPESGCPIPLGYTPSPKLRAKAINVFACGTDTCLLAMQALD